MSVIKTFYDTMPDGREVYQYKIENNNGVFVELLTRGATLASFVCPDRDGVMAGTNLDLYRTMSRRYNVDITASGGVSTMDDIRALKDMDMYGAIIGKAYYTGAIDLKEAVEAVK